MKNQAGTSTGRNGRSRHIFYDDFDRCVALSFIETSTGFRSSSRNVLGYHDMPNNSQ
jgi:hypothetical protein